MPKFEVGQKVVVLHGRFGREPKLSATVESITARKMVLSDGSEWSADGQWHWGRARERYSSEIVRPWELGDDEVLERASIMAVLSQCHFEELSTEKRRAIVAIIQGE